MASNPTKIWMKKLRNSFIWFSDPLATCNCFRKRFLRFHLGRFFPFGCRKTCTAWGWWGLWPRWWTKNTWHVAPRCDPLRPAVCFFSHAFVRLTRSASLFQAKRRVVERIAWHGYQPKPSWGIGQVTWGVCSIPHCHSCHFNPCTLKVRDTCNWIPWIFREFLYHTGMGKWALQSLLWHLAIICTISS